MKNTLKFRPLNANEITSIKDGNGASIRITLDANEFVLLEQWPSEITAAQISFSNIQDGFMSALHFLFGY